MEASPMLWAASDLHLREPGNRRLVSEALPTSNDDWLLLAGDIGTADDLRWLLATVRSLFAGIIFVPGNHDLWVSTEESDSGEAYDRLLDVCHDFDVLTPRDPWFVLETMEGPRYLVPLMMLYDYTGMGSGSMSPEEALAQANEAGVVFSDEYFLRPPQGFASIAEWSRVQVADARQGLNALPATARTILINHYPLTARPLGFFRCPYYALWSGTSATFSWPERYRASHVIYGHQHIPHRFVENGVTYQEVSLGYPREHRQRYPVLRAVCKLAR